jgi:hypothetical protein
VDCLNPAGIAIGSWRVDLAGVGVRMSQFSADMESGIESELVDLGAISMRVLREWDGTVIRRALRHVMERTEHPRVTAGGGSDGGGGERLD